MRRYIIFEGGGQGECRAHTAVYLARAASTEEAIRRWVDEIVGREDIEWRPDGSLSEQWGRTTVVYPHVLAYIEANERIYHEWQIRLVPEWLLDLNVTEVFCGEDWTVDQYVEECRPLLRMEFPRSRAKAFVWYTTRGPLVTFYNGARPLRYRVLRRYLIPQDNGWQPVAWEGDYGDLCRELDLGAVPETRPSCIEDTWI